LVTGLDSEQQLTLAALYLYLMSRDIDGSPADDASKKAPIRDS
jgi:hypothetical protein